MKWLRKFAVYTGVAALVCVILAVIAFGVAYFYYSPKLPDVEKLATARLSVPMKIYTSDHKLIARYGSERRSPVKYDQFPPQLIHAVLSAEDAKFFNQGGISIKGLARATINLILTGKKSQGGSTITMQVARNYFLTDRKTYSRKFKEILLAMKIDREFSKKKILQLYLNKIYYGEGAYGVAAAAHVYYGKSLDELDLSQIAMLAGLPKAPSAANPIVDPAAALARRGYVLARMHYLNYITDEQYQQARQAPLTADTGVYQIPVTANYLAEMVRRKIVHQVGKKQAYSAGYKVITTINSKRQMAAVRAVRERLIRYSEQQGYRGPIDHISLASDEGGDNPSQDVKKKLAKYHPVGGLLPALVTGTDKQGATVLVASQGTQQLRWKAMSWARSKGHEHPLQRGDVVRVKPPQGKDGHWELAQVPKVQGALVAVNPKDGAVEALVGGFAYANSAFNRVTQAHRQPGSSFKPFVYSAALESGMNQATLIPNAPLMLPNGDTWRPQNYERRFGGLTPVREGLIHSLNLVSVRILQRTGLEKARRYITKFGLPLWQLPDNLTLALGSASVTPMQMARAYSVFANGGSLIRPYYVKRIVNQAGETLYQAQPQKACPPPNDGDGDSGEDSDNIEASATGGAVDGGEASGSGGEAEQDFMPIDCAPRAITPQNAYIMTQMMHGVIQSGTGRFAKQLGRKDLAGKTGTSNKQVNAWFDGYNADLVTVTWMGFDQPKSLGRRMTGARAALPIWMGFMGAALKDRPPARVARPSGLVTARINPKTGKRVAASVRGSVFETFRKDNIPGTQSSLETSSRQRQGHGQGGSGGSAVRQLY
jgi:penicillin-binding protein 1A